MTQEQEKQLLQAIYDRLFDAVTYQPAGSKIPLPNRRHSSISPKMQRLI